MQGHAGGGARALSPTDIAVIASSLPASFGHPRAGHGWFGREYEDESVRGVGHDSSARGEGAGRGGAGGGGEGYGGMMAARYGSVHGRRGSHSQRESVTSEGGGAEAEHAYGRVQPPMPVCLICLEMLTPLVRACCSLRGCICALRACAGARPAAPGQHPRAFRASPAAPALPSRAALCYPPPKHTHIHPCTRAHTGL